VLKGGPTLAATDAPDTLREPVAGAGPAQLQRLAGRYVGLALVAFTLITAVRGPLPNMQQRAVHLGLAVIITFAFYPSSGTRWGRALNRKLTTAVDVILQLAGAVTAGYVVLYFDRFLRNPIDWSTTDITMGAVAIAVICWAAWRTIGPWVPALALLTLLYAVLGEHLPDPLSHGGVPFDVAVHTIYMTTVGIWGTLLDISATVIAVLLVFGALLLATGGVDTLVGIGRFLSGRAYGGAGYVAITASSLFGMVTGSPTANAATTGAFTIPMMKRTGVKAGFAAGLEAAASSGSQLVPPILGAGAFIMAELLGIPYLEVAVAAILPAILYYLAVFVMYGIGVRGMDLRETDMTTGDGPQLNPLGLASVAQFVLPVAALILAISRGYTPTTAGILAIAVAVAIWLVASAYRRNLRAGLGSLLEGAEASIRPIVLIATILGSVSIFVASINMSGLGIRISSLILGFGGSNPTGILLAGMLVAIVLGLGIPTVGAYVIGAAVVVPPLIQFGIDPIVAHFFVFYYAVFADVTPPLCPIVNVTAAQADAPWGETALHAMTLAIGGFLLPFLFVLYPELLLTGSVDVEAVIGFVLAAAVVLMTGIALLGYFYSPLTKPERTLLGAVGIAAVLLLNKYILILAVATGAAFLVWHVWRTRNRHGSPQRRRPASTHHSHTTPESPDARR
jgi:TRAP transporter 4TM/12TM fusion protein